MQAITNLMNYTGLVQPNCHSSGRYSLSAPNIARNLNKIAIPAILLLGASLVQEAEAGPIAYAICISGCEWPLFSIVARPVSCHILCLPALAAPTS